MAVQDRTQRQLARTFPRDHRRQTRALQSVNEPACQAMVRFGRGVIQVRARSAWCRCRRGSFGDAPALDSLRRLRRRLRRAEPSRIGATNERPVWRCEGCVIIRPSALRDQSLCSASRCVCWHGKFDQFSSRTSVALHGGDAGESAAVAPAAITHQQLCLSAR